MAELKDAIQELKEHVKKGRLTGREFADTVIAALEAIEQRLPPVARTPVRRYRNTLLEVVQRSPTGNVDLALASASRQSSRALARRSRSEHEAVGAAGRLAVTITLQRRSRQRHARDPLPSRWSDAPCSQPASSLLT